jgi:hypothetical protein
LLFHHVNVLQNAAPIAWQCQAHIAVRPRLDAALDYRWLRGADLASPAQPFPVKMAVSGTVTAEPIASFNRTWCCGSGVTAFRDLPGRARIAVRSDTPAVHRAQTARLTLPAASIDRALSLRLILARFGSASSL